MHSLLPLGFLVISIWVSFSLASARPDISPSRHNFGSSEQFLNARGDDRVLRAARLKSDLGPRAMNKAIRHDYELHYLDDSLLGKPTQFAAQVRLETRKPTLLLEEIEDDLHEIRCAKGIIQFGFVLSETFELAWGEYSRIGEFFLITSHEGCNNDGERGAYLVSKVTRASDEMLIIMAVSKIPWKNAFRTMTVDFGGTNAEFEVRRHGELRRRSIPSKTTKAIVTSTTTSTSDLAHKFIPIPTNTPRPKDSNYHGNLSSQHGPEISLTSPLGLIVKCKNCSTDGVINIIQGSFTVNGSVANDAPSNETNIVDYIKNGYVKLHADNFTAHIELESTIQPSTLLTLYSIPLPEIGLPGFQIPGIAIIGPIFRPLFQVGFEASASATFVYGFDMTVPNNSSIKIEIFDITHSSITGFQNTLIKALPLQSQAPSISLTLSAGFTPEILIGISLFDGIGTAAAGAIFSLPVITAEISQVSNVTSTCEPALNSSSLSSSSSGFVDQHIFNSLTHIVPKVDFAIALIAQAEAGPIGMPIFEEHAAYTVWNKSVPLPTACFSYRADKKSYGAPTVSARSTSVKATGTNAAAESSSKKGSAAAVNPFVGWRFVVFGGVFLLGEFFPLGMK